MLVTVYFCVIIALASAAEDKCEKLAVDITDGVNENGTIHFKNVTYPVGKYYKENNKIYGCICSVVKNCIRKCCPEGYVYRNKKCREMNYSVDSDMLEKLFTLIHNRYCEFHFLQPDKYSEEKYFLHVNDTLTLPSFPLFLNGDDFCYDLVVHNQQRRLRAAVCFDNFKDRPFLFLQIGMIAAVPLFFLTFLVYMSFCELRNIHGKSVMLFVGFNCIEFAFRSSLNFNAKFPESYCESAAIIILFTILASSFWINVMCIDIYWTFSSYPLLSENRRFLVYCIYAFGTAFLIGVFIFIFEEPERKTSPIYTGASCWFPDLVNTFIYTIMFIITLLNIGLLSHTKIRINKLITNFEENKDCENRNCKYENNKERFILYWTIVIVHSVNWLFIFGMHLVPDPRRMMYFADMYDFFYGFIIFILLVCKPSVTSLIKQRYYGLIGKPYLEPCAALHLTTSSIILNRSESSSTATSNVTLETIPD